jgi:hypothetical protein
MKGFCTPPWFHRKARVREKEVKEQSNKLEAPKTKRRK